MLVLRDVQTPRVSGRSADRFLTTVLMTDMVASTQLAAELGDRGWRELVQLHNALVRGALRRHDGREMDTAGDGFFAVFDAPRRSPLDAPDEGPADAAPPGLWVDGGTAGLVTHQIRAR